MLRDAWAKFVAKVRFYYSLNHEFRLVQENVNVLVHQPPWLKLFDQDRFRLMEELERERQSKGYEQSFEEKEPLISVRIATYNNSKELLERAIPSVLKQTYKNWEIIIVGDYCTDDTEKKVKALNDKRIRFTDLSYHYRYPEYQVHRWMAQGVMAHNQAVRMCKGSWIAPLDDDNEFLPNHLDVLLRKVQREKLELVYGNMISIDRETGEKKRVGGFPPAIGNFDFSACLYNRALRIFPFDINSYLFYEVCDTNMIRRLSEAGVRMGFINRYVTNYWFRKPGSPRVKETFPNQKYTYDLLKMVENKPGDLDMPQADLLLETIRDSLGDTLVLGNENKKLTAFVTAVFKKKLSFSTSKLMISSDLPKQKKKFDVVILNLLENVVFKKYATICPLVSINGLLYLHQGEELVAKLNSDPHFELVQDHLYFKLAESKEYDKSNRNSG